MSKENATSSTYLTDEDIVRLAYSTAISSERFYDLFDALESRLDDQVAQDSADAATDVIVDSAFGTLEPQFENALSLMNMATPGGNGAQYSVQAMEHDVRPGILIGLDNKVRYANAAAQNVLGIRADATLNVTHFEAGFFDAYRTAMTTLEDADDNQMVAIVSFEKTDGSGALRAGLRRVIGNDQQVMGQVIALNTSWNDTLAQRFKAAMKLTPPELDIVRAIVTGVPLRVLAADQGRAVGAVRLQAQDLLGKLSLKSQTELVCLFASFSELDSGRMNDRANVDGTGSKLHVLPDGRNLEYVLAGPANGTPAIFLPALLGGVAFTPQMHRQIYQRNIRLIMVWRPGMARSDPDGGSDFGAFARHSADLVHLMDALDIAKCPVIGHVTGAMFACAVASHAPDRVSRVICINGTVPAVSGPHVPLIDRTERLRFSLLRKTPRIGRLVVHALLSKVDAAFDKEFLRALLTTDVDLATLQDPDIQETFRSGYQKTVYQGYDSFVRELTLAAHNWEPLVQDMPQTLTFLVGEENVIYTPDVMVAYAADHLRVDVKVIPATGHLMLYQAFDTVLGEITKS